MEKRYRKYEYVMESSEIREFCVAALWEQVKCRKGAWLRLLLIVMMEFFILPKAAVIIIVMLAVVFIASGIYNYVSLYRLLAGQPWNVRVEDGKLKVERKDYSEVPCRNIQFIRIRKQVLMLGYMQSVKRPVWYVIPLRVFADEREREEFLSQIRNPQPEGRAAYADTAVWGTAQSWEEAAQETAAVQEMTEKPQEYMGFDYMLDGERWVRFQKGAADILNSTSLGKPLRLYGMMIWGAVVTLVMTVCIYLAAGTLNWMLFAFGFSITIWMILRLYLRSPEKALRKQLKSPEIAVKVCGAWRVSLAKEGITVDMPMGMSSLYSWESLGWLLETEEVFYIFHRDKKHYIMIAKQSFVSWEQVDAFHRLCVEHGIEKIAPKRAFYVPGWLTWVIFGLIMGVSLTVFTMTIFRDTADVSEDASWERDGGSAAASLSAYPDSVPLDQQVSVLASLGISVPEETVTSIKDFMAEYDMYDQVEGNPYTWLLMDVGAPEYDEEWNLTGYSEQVFWFDFEGFDISTDYIDILNGMLALAQGSPVDSVGNIRENMDDADWERGRGTVTVSLDWQGKTYLYDMEMYDDWIDEKVLGVLNPLLQKEDSQKYFYATGDDGQGAIVFFCTPEWAEEFMHKTGLVLERPSAKADKIQ